MKEKKPYEAPEMKIYQVQKANIIATSTTRATGTEEYGTVNPAWY